LGRTQQKHGLTHGPEWKAWDAARSRCYREKDKGFKWYGARGIKMCDRWRYSFANFLEDMGRRPKGKKRYTLERKDSNGDYEPGNCEWATYEAQLNNRPSFNRYIKLRGRRMTIAQAARKVGLTRNAVYARLRRGWSEKEALRKTRRGK